MKFQLNQRDQEKIEKLFQTNEQNYRITDLLSEYYHNYARSISPKDVLQTMKKKHIDEETAFFFCLLNLMGVRKNENKRISGFRKGIHRLDVLKYKDNPFLQNIRFSESISGNTRFLKDSYLPYEGFPYADIDVDPDDYYRETCSVGFFDKEFFFPSLIQNEITWMSVIPNEIETMKAPISSAKGRVLVYGLGIGYYAYMIHLKEEVRLITVIEKDKNIIDLFYKNLFPQFPRQDKIRIIHTDALEYEKKSEEFYDMAFVDLYHDETDGIPLYLKLKKSEKRAFHYEYWLEKSLIEVIRRDIITLLYEQYHRLEVDYDDAENDNDALINALHRHYEKKIFLSYAEIKEMLSENAILKLLKEI